MGDKMFIDYYSFVFNSFIFYFNDLSFGLSKQYFYNVVVKVGLSRVIDDKNSDNDKNDDDGESERYCKIIVVLLVRQKGFFLVVLLVFICLKQRCLLIIIDNKVLGYFSFGSFIF